MIINQPIRARLRVEAEHPIHRGELCSVLRMALVFFYANGGTDGILRSGLRVERKQDANEQG